MIKKDQNSLVTLALCTEVILNPRLHSARSVKLVTPNLLHSYSILVLRILCSKLGVEYRGYGFDRILIASVNSGIIDEDSRDFLLRVVDITTNPSYKNSKKISEFILENFDNFDNLQSLLLPSDSGVIPRKPKLFDPLSSHYLVYLSNRFKGRIRLYFMVRASDLSNLVNLLLCVIINVCLFPYSIH